MVRAWLCLGSIILGPYYSSFCCVVMQVSREVRVCVCVFVTLGWGGPTVVGGPVPYCGAYLYACTSITDYT